MVTSLTREILGSTVLFENKFELAKRTFYRELPTGVRHVLFVDMNMQATKVFVVVGLNSRVVSRDIPADQAGVCHAHYLTPGGVVTRQAAYPAKNKEQLTASLVRAAQACREHAMPWFDAFQTLESVADVLPDDDDVLKGELLLAHGAPGKARPWLLRYRGRLLAMAPSPEVIEALRSTDSLLARCQVPG